MAPRLAAHLLGLCNVVAGALVACAPAILMPGLDGLGSPGARLLGVSLGVVLAAVGIGAWLMPADARRMYLWIFGVGRQGRGCGRLGGHGDDDRRDDAGGRGGVRPGGRARHCRHAANGALARVEQARRLHNPHSTSPRRRSASGRRSTRWRRGDAGKASTRECPPPGSPCRRARAGARARWR